MSLDPNKQWLMDRPKLTREQELGVKAQRQKEMLIGRAFRKAKQDGDLKGMDAAWKMGYQDRGIESVDDKRRRHINKVYDRNFHGDMVVGGKGQQGAPQQRQEQGPRGQQGPVGNNGVNQDGVRPSLDEEAAAGLERSKSSGAFGGKPSDKLDALNNRSKANNLMSQYERGQISSLDLIDKSYNEVAGSTREGVEGAIARVDKRNADKREAVDTLKEQYTSGAMSKEEFLEKGKALGGSDKSLGAITDPVDSANREEMDARAQKAKVDAYNKAVLGKDRTPYEKLDSSIGLEDRMAKSEAERVARQKEIDSIIGGANDVVKQSDDRISELDNTRAENAIINESRALAIKAEQDLISNESKGKPKRKKDHVYGESLAGDVLDLTRRNIKWAGENRKEVIDNIIVPLVDTGREWAKGNRKKVKEVIQKYKRAGNYIIGRPNPAPVAINTDKASKDVASIFNQMNNLKDHTA
jgi:hypothetical protein